MLEVTKEYVDKLKVLADLEAELFGEGSTGYRNRNEYKSALRQWEKQERKVQVLAMRNDPSIPCATGAEYEAAYHQLLSRVCDTSHEELQHLMADFADSIDFRGMELDRYAVGGDLGYHLRLYLRTTPEDEIKNLVSPGPDILQQIKVLWTPMGIWKAFLLFAAKDWIELNWHALYAANDIVGPDNWRNPVAPPWMGMTNPEHILPDPAMAEGYSIPYPSVRILGDTALIHYVCHLQHHNRYVDRYAVIFRYAESIRVDAVEDEPNTQIINVAYVGDCLY